MSSMLCPGIPEMQDGYRGSELCAMTSLMLTRRSAPTGTPAGPRIRAPSRMKIGIWQLRMVMLLIVTSSSSPPSTVSSARPRQNSKTTLEMAMLRNPPLDSVPNLIRPVRPNVAAVLYVPSISVPRSYPLTMQLSMVTFSVARATLNAYELFSTIASSPGELTVVLEISTLRHSFRAIALLPCNGADSWAPPRTRPLPSMVPGPKMVMLVSPSPQIRLLCQWLCP